MSGCLYDEHGGTDVRAGVSVLPVVESDTARVSVLPVAGSELPAVFFGEGRLGCGRTGRWPAMSLSGFGGNPAGFARRAR